MRTSVCAVRDAADVAAVVDGGADAVGVLVMTRHRAEDAVDLSTGAALLGEVPPYVGRYAVTHATELVDLLRIVDELPIDTLQLHDDVALDVVEALRSQLPDLRLIKALHVTGDRVAEPSVWDGVVDALIVDSVNPAENRIGGTGLVHDWSLSAAVVAEAQIPVVLAGGLGPHNVSRAVDVVKPWAVNVNSGVEVDGHKATELVRRFVEQASSHQDDDREFRPTVSATRSRSAS